MTTSRTHSCNLCRCTVVDGSGVGIEWTGAKIGDLMRFRAPSCVENHICQDCLDGIEHALEEQRTDMRRRDELAATEAH